MSSIRVKSSLALDTLCFLEKRLSGDTDGMNERQLEEIRSINALLPKDFGDEYIGMSNICPIVSACLADDPEDLALDDLIDLFRDPKRVEKPFAIYRGILQKSGFWKERGKSTAGIARHRSRSSNCCYGSPGSPKIMIDG